MKKAGAVCVGLFWFWVRLVLGEVGSRGRLILCEVGVYFLFFTPTFSQRGLPALQPGSYSLKSIGPKLS